MRPAIEIKEAADIQSAAVAMPKGVKRMVLSPAVGFLSVLMGIGGGSFGVPLMTLHGVAVHRAVATAAGFGVIIAVPSVAGFLLLEVDPAVRPPLTIGAVNLAAFFIVIAMTLITAPWGVKLAHGPKRMGEVIEFPGTDGKTYKAKIVDAVFYDKDGEKQNV